MSVLTALVVAGWRPLLSCDVRVARDLHAHAVAHPGVTQVMRVFSDWVWDPWTMRTLAAVACVLLWWRGDRERALRVALATVLATAVQQGLKALAGRERPVWPDPVDSAQYAAYPSGHAMTAAVVCGLLLWLLPRPVSPPLARPLPRTLPAWAAGRRLGGGRGLGARGRLHPCLPRGPLAVRRGGGLAARRGRGGARDVRIRPSARVRRGGPVKGVGCLLWAIPRFTQSRRPRALSILALSQSTQE